MHPSALSLEISRPTILAFCGILRLPSLLVRALTPMQLFGLRKAPDLSLALPQVLPREDTGSGPATGGCLLQPPVCVVSTVFLTQGRDPRPLGRGRVRDGADMWHSLTLPIPSGWAPSLSRKRERVFLPSRACAGMTIEDNRFIFISASQ